MNVLLNLLLTIILKAYFAVASCGSLHLTEFKLIEESLNVEKISNVLFNHTSIGNFNLYIQASKRCLSFQNPQKVERIIEALLSNTNNLLWTKLSTDQLISFFTPISQITNDPAKFWVLMQSVYAKARNKEILSDYSIILQLLKNVCIYHPNQMSAFHPCFVDWSMDTFYNLMVSMFDDNDYILTITLFMFTMQISTDQWYQRSDSWLTSMLEMQWKSIIAVTQQNINNQKDIAAMMQIQQITSNIMNSSRIKAIPPVLYSLELHEMTLLYSTSSIECDLLFNKVNKPFIYNKFLKMGVACNTVDFCGFSLKEITFFLRWTFFYGLKLLPHRFINHNLVVKCNSMLAADNIASEFAEWRIFAEIKTLNNETTFNLSKTELDLFMDSLLDSDSTVSDSVDCMELTETGGSVQLLDNIAWAIN